MKFLFPTLLLLLLSWSSQLKAQTATLNPQLTTAEIHLAVQNIARELNLSYVSADKAKVASAELLAKLSSGHFNGQYDFSLLNHEITTILFQATQDSGFELIQQQPTTLAVFDQHNVDFPTSQHDEFTTGILDHNIGYVKITGNFQYPNASDMLTEQLQLLAGVDALIIDLRLADEAAIAVVQQLMSYFVQAETKIANIKFNQHVETLTAANITGYEKFKQDFPLYIVNSAFVAGSWEFFGYTLQQFNKAIIVGENTMGFDHIRKIVRISDSIAFKMNHATITHPVTTENWENDGVVPDYFYQSADAFNKAYSLALQQIAAD
ncbi:hypothetical protein A5320_02310 [Rheinheimera sp. SA_1]|uniref:S41 family peptidase n=1 Tax=Rheinheimera sp. SA_1 TaxID=1827365 RepID=UPI000801EEC5|nr:S41 family peptidase [Rheinheimera sp. SA_1]OBP16264.1 hypothetical protein A5320_02310 [Rheinheimera sp. SA_1]